MEDQKPSTIFEQIRRTGCDDDFEPTPTEEFQKTDAPVGSRDKVNILADRVRRGLPLWHPEDRKICDTRVRDNKP